MSRSHSLSSTNLVSKPFFGGCEDFSTSPAADDPKSHSTADANRAMLDELVHYWTHEAPQMFSASKPTLRALSYFPLKIVAAEWVNYIAIMGLSVREYELSTTLSGDLIAQLEKLNTNLRILQGWRRRVLSTQAKLRRTLRFIENHVDRKQPNEDWDRGSGLR
jgi:hypothetical protein